MKSAFLQAEKNLRAHANEMAAKHLAPKVRDNWPAIREAQLRKLIGRVPDTKEESIKTLESRIKAQQELVGKKHPAYDANRMFALKEALLNEQQYKPIQTTASDLAAVLSKLGG